MVLFTSFTGYCLAAVVSAAFVAAVVESAALVSAGLAAVVSGSV